jgi:dipeptidyl-peptidase-4
VDGSGDRPLLEPDGPTPDEVGYGLADFVAAEEMDRGRGFWWSPAGDALLVCRVDQAPVQRWHIADPANPERPPSVERYPAAGSDNAMTSLVLVGLDGARREVRWERSGPGDGEYLARVTWSAAGPPLIAVQSRDQRTVHLLTVDTATGATTLLRTDTDPHWVELFVGAPGWTPDGRLVRVVADQDGYRLHVGSDPVTPPDLRVRTVLDIGQDILFSASAADSTQVHVFVADEQGVRALTTEPGVHHATRAGRVLVTGSSGLEHFGSIARVWRDGAVLGTVSSLTVTPPLTPNVRMLVAGERDLRCALLLPTGHTPGSGQLPVLLDPYGGPGAQRVLTARNAYLSSQWFADQGFAVLVVDGRGTPGRSLAWTQAINREFAEVTLEDQVDALHALAAVHPELDLSRVAIRGWSYGGYLAALAVLRRPDVFHAAVAGAPVTDWRLYDTHYTERYLGDPRTEPEVYERNSLISDAAKLSRPLMLIHGLADDNVVAAHTLRLSAALLAAGRPHTVLPLSGVTHMTPQEQVAENLLLLQVDFLRSALARAGQPAT